MGKEEVKGEVKMGVKGRPPIIPRWGMREERGESRDKR